MRPSSEAVTSARHSRRPPRIRRNSSWPGCVSEPTVAARAEITPSSGETTRVCARRSSSACTLARAATTREAAVFSAVRYWLICCLVNAPSGPIWRARSAFAVASAAIACGLGERRLRLRELRLDGVVVDAGEDLALLHPVADVRQHLGQALAADLRADHRLLPGGDVAVGRQHLRPLRRLQRNRRHGQRGRSAPRRPCRQPARSCVRPEKNQTPAAASDGRGYRRDARSCLLSSTPMLTRAARLKLRGRDRPGARGRRAAADCPVPLMTMRPFSST